MYALYRLNLLPHRGHETPREEHPSILRPLSVSYGNLPEVEIHILDAELMSFP